MRLPWTPLDPARQDASPYVDALRAFIEADHTRWGIPGHQGSPDAQTLLADYVGERVLELDVQTMVEGIDLGPDNPFDTGIHTHSSESIWEVQESLKRWGRRPIEVFEQRGILGPHTVVAHCVWLDDREIDLLARLVGRRAGGQTGHRFRPRHREKCAWSPSVRRPR